MSNRGGSNIKDSTWKIMPNWVLNSNVVKNVNHLMRVVDSKLGHGGGRSIKWLFQQFSFLIRFKVIKPKFWKLNMKMCNLLVNYSWNIHGQIFGTTTMMHRLREETFTNNILVIYGLICKNLFLSLIGSTAFKLSDLLTTFLFFRLFNNSLMKAYFLVWSLWW